MTAAPIANPQGAAQRQALIAAAIVVALITGAIMVGGTIVMRQVVSGLMLGSIYMTVAVAFTLTIGVLNFLNFTIPTLFMLTGMVAWGLASRGWSDVRRHLGWLAALTIGSRLPSWRR